MQLFGSMMNGYGNCSWRKKTKPKQWSNRAVAVVAAMGVDRGCGGGEGGWWEERGQKNCRDKRVGRD